MNQTDMRLQSSFIVDWGLDFITKGLSTKLLVAFDSKAYNTRNAQREYDAYGSHTATSTTPPACCASTRKRPKAAAPTAE